MDRQAIRRQLSELNTVLRETDAVYSRLAKQSGISDCAFWLLYSIREADGKCTQRELCDQWMFSKQTVNSALKNLEKNGYITLIPSQTDKRTKHIALTGNGLLLAHEKIDVVFQMEELALEKMSAAERDAMIATARKYLDLFSAETEHFLE